MQTAAEPESSSDTNGAVGVVAGCSVSAGAGAFRQAPPPPGHAMSPANNPIGSSDSAVSPAVLDFPIPLIIAGVRAVIIPDDEYLRLRLGSQRVRPPTVDRQRLFCVSRSPIARDAEVAEFLSSRFGSKTVDEILTECAQRFGDKRTPSASAAHRYWQRLRLATK